MYCTKCGQPVGQSAKYCTKCGKPIVNSNQVKVTGLDDDALKYIIPIGRSGLSIAAGYAGLFAFVVIPAPLALVLGILALIDIKKHPEKLGAGRAWFAVVSGTAFSLVLLWFLLVASK